MIIPKQIIIEVSSRCQLRCVGCPINGGSNNGTYMDLDLFKSIIDRIDFPTVVIPWMNGEPLLHPNYAEMVKYITDKNIPCYITTNGMIWNDELFEHITNGTSCYQIIFSLDGLPWSNSVELARPGTDRKKVIENIKRFGSLKKMKGDKLDMAVKICQRGQDWSEIEEYIVYWLYHSYIDYVCYGKMLAGECEAGQRRSPCQYFDNNFLILRADASSRLCAYNDRIVNGNENPVGTLGPTESLLDFYNNAAFTQYRRSQNLGIYKGPCETCGFAYTGFGMEGTLDFRSRKLPNKVYYHQDYYNQFFSLKDKKKPAEYYNRRAK
jgi:organic radical activating enzyme